jgi:hypothetical protein
MRRLKLISESEKRRRAKQRRQRRERARTAMGRMLYDRDQAKFLLGNVSESTLRRLEKSGRLHPVKPSGSRVGKTFYRHEDIVAIATNSARTDVIPYENPRPVITTGITNNEVDDTSFENSNPKE